MFRRRAPIFFIAMSLATTAFAAGWGDPARVWRVVSIDGKPFQAHATITFPAEGGLQGEGPCNSFHATLAGDYPQFTIGPVLTTRMACPDMQAESAFLSALSAMAQGKIDGDKLTLTGPDDRSMSFQPD